MADGAPAAAGQSAGESSEGSAGSVNNTAQTASEGETLQADVNSEVKPEKAEKTTEASEKTEKAEAPEKTTQDQEEEKEEKETKEEVKKHKYADRLTKAFPDRKFEKDDDYDSALDEHLTDLEGYKEKGVTLNKKLIALFESEPKLASAIQDSINGSTFRAAMARHYAPEDFTPQDGDDDQEAWNENKTKREQSLAQMKQKQQERENNLKLSTEAITAFATENKMDEDSAGEFLKKIDEMVSAINSGLITKDALLAMRRAFNYEQDIAKAKEDAELAGTNKNIVAKKEAPEKKGDGLPKLTKSGEEPEAPKAELTYMDELVNKVNAKKVL
jgi:hypothetical protein